MHAPMFRPLRAIGPVVLAVSTILSAGPLTAQFSDDAQRQAQCELTYMRDTLSPLAISWIRTACNRLAIDSGLDERNRRFHLCLLESLPGVQADIAADRIITACRA